MDNSLSDLTGQPRPLRIRVRGEERTYRVHPLTIDDLGKLQGWVDAQFPGAFESATRAVASGAFNVTQQQFILKTAMELDSRRRHLIGTPEAEGLLTSIEGTMQILLVSIRKGNPDFSDEDARELRLHMGLGHLAQLYRDTGVEAVLSDPKGGGGSGSESGKRTSRPTRGPRSTGGKSTTKR